jgi:hypothetical protein
MQSGQEPSRIPGRSQKIDRLHQAGEYVGVNDGNILPVFPANGDDLMIARHTIEDAVKRPVQSGI